MSVHLALPICRLRITWQWNRSVSNYDVRHRFNLVANWELPIGKGKPILGHAGRLVNAIAAAGN